ncbi:MAG TPA: HEAT repeat domain-containing protein [Polyangiaceae bacterium]
MRLPKFAALLLLVPALAWGQPGPDELADQVRHGDDFRVRVQAALQLGKSLSPDAVAPLSDALDDTNASVRAAAAAALKTLGDAHAIPALKEHRLDRSEAVRAAIAAALRSLEEERTGTAKARVVVKLGMMKNGSNVKSTKIESELADASRRKLSELPGVRVLNEESPSKPGENVPMVMVTGKIQELKASREGSSIVYSASVEYVLHTMPEQSIAAKVSGHASATASEQEANDQSRSAELRRAVLEAAIASALRRAPPALMAAARL